MPPIQSVRRAGLGRRLSEIVAEPGAGGSSAASEILLGASEAIPFEAVPTAMLIVDSAARAVAFNRRWLEQSRLSAPSTAGTGWMEALGAGSAEEIRRVVGEVAAGRTDGALDVVWAGPGSRRGRCWLTSYRRTGEVFVGLILTDIPRDEERIQPARYEAYRALVAELPSLLDSLESLLGTIADTIERDPSLWM